MQPGHCGCAGYPDQAERQSAEVLDLAQQLDYPVNQAFALALTGMLYQFRGETDKVKKYADAAFAIAAEYDYAQWLGMSVMLQGWVKAMSGEHAVGIAQIQQGLAGWRASGSRLSMPHNLLLLAEAQAVAELPDDALSTIDEALATSQETGERFLDAELLRLKGDLLLRCGANNTGAQAKHCFQNAIDIAQLQQSKAWQLRATVSLCKLWRQQNKIQHAYQQLKIGYERFTEGFATADLRAAKTLLQSLATSTPVMRR